MHSFRVDRRAVSSFIRRADALGLTKGARQRLAWFMFALEHEGNVSLACRHFGIARSTFMRWADRFDSANADSLEDESKRPHRMRAPVEDASAVKRIEELRRAQPYIRKEEIFTVLSAEGKSISASTIGRIISRHGFFFGATPAHIQKRTDALAKLSDTGEGETRSAATETSTDSYSFGADTVFGS